MAHGEKLEHLSVKKKTFFEWRGECRETGKIFFPSIPVKKSPTGFKDMHRLKNPWRDKKISTVENSNSKYFEKILFKMFYKKCHF
jgi:hypothetical protein